MPNSVDENHSPSEFYYSGETNYSNATCQGERIAPNKTTTKTATKQQQQQQKQLRKSVFWSFLQNQNNKAI